MKKKIFGLTTFLLVLIGCFFACERNNLVGNEQVSNENCSSCAEKEVIEVLENELVTIYFSSYPILSSNVDSLGFVREENEQNIQNNRRFLFPCFDQVPLEYRKEGQKVRISGNITNCSVSMYAPDAKLLPAYIFELTLIRKEDI